MRMIADIPTVEDADIAEQCPECGNEVWLKWDVERDGYTIYCPHCGYRIKLRGMCDVPDGMQFRTVDDLGRICLPKDIRDKLGIKPGTECAVYATDELTSDEIIVIRRKKNDKTN